MFFQVLTLQGALGMFFRKNHLKTISKLVWTLSGTFLDTFQISNFFRFFFEFFQFSTIEGALVKFFYRKNYLEACSKCVWPFRGTFLGILKKNESFSIFLVFFHVSTLQGALGKTFSEKYLKTSSKLVWKLLRTFWIILGIQIFSILFSNFWSPGCTGREKFEKSHLKTNLDTFGNVFRDFENLIFFPFFEIFRLLDPPGCTEQKISIKSPQNMFGHSKERFWTLLKFQIVFDFFFRIVPSFDPSVCTGHFFFREKTSKQVQNLFEHFWKRVWVSWILRIFCISLKFFDVSTVQGALAKKSRKNHIKTCLDNLGNVFGHFWKFEFFSISVELFRVSTVHWAEFFSVEIIMQHMIKQCFWERFWRILKVSKFFHFFVFFAGFDHPGCTGQKFLPKKLPLSMLKTCLIAFGNVFSGNLKNWKFFQFFGILPSFDSPGCTGRLFPKKITSNQFQNLFGHF